MRGAEEYVASGKPSPGGMIPAKPGWNRRRTVKRKEVDGGRRAEGRALNKELRRTLRPPYPVHDADS